MSLIQVQDLTFSYPGSFDPVFEHASFQLDTDWKLGFVGRNGRGKTTFLRLLQGQYPYQGSIRASVEFDYFPFAVEDPWLPLQELAGQHCLQLEDWRLARELSLLGMDPDTRWQPYATLSQGQQTKALLAMLFLRENRFLLIDEPTNHLDLEARQAVSRYLAKKKGFILVSHDRAFLDGCVDHILSINKCTIQVMRGNYSTWEMQQQRQEQFEAGQNEKLKRQIGQLEAAARQTAAWSDKVEASKKNNDPSKKGAASVDRGFIGHKAAKMMQRSKAIERRQAAAIEEKKGLLKDREEIESLKLWPQRHPKKVLARVEALTAWYGEHKACGPVSLTVEQGQRIALQGPNGCGKSTLFRLLLGQWPAELHTTGRVETASGLIVSYVPQSTGDVAGSLAGYEQARGLEASLFRAVLRKLGFERVQFEKDLAGYSAGQKKKLALAASLCQKAHLYLWDEPLNYIDLPARQQLEELLLTFAPTLLFVEHDQRFVETVATQVIRLE